MSLNPDVQADTPAMRQYRTFKEQYPDYVLLFRMGDFYETFYEDAKIASRTLGLTLTSRSKGPNAVPLAGIPYHALDNYLGRLIQAGYRVALCEQIEDPKEAKGVVKRDVVRLITPGTLTDETLLEQREGNYLAAIFSVGRKPQNCDSPSVGLAWVELSSGAFWAMLAPAQTALDELVRINPAEVIYPEGSEYDQPKWRDHAKQVIGCAFSSRAPWAFDKNSSVQTLHNHFHTATLAGFGFDEWDESVSAAGAIIEYLNETQKTAMGHICELRRFERRDYMAIDGNTLRCLEVLRTLRTNSRQGSLLACIDRTKTGMGARLLERWLTFPLVCYSSIIARQDAVEFFISRRKSLDALRELLGDCAQIDRITTNIAMARVRPREFVALGQSLALLPRVAEYLDEDADKLELLTRLRPAIENLDEPLALIETAIDPDCPNVVRDGGVIRNGFNEELDRLRAIDRDGQSWLAEYQQQESQRTGIPLKVGYNKVFGYYIEITHTHRDKVPPEYHRKQTLKNAERYITDELKHYEAEVLTASERAKEIEQQLYEQVRVSLLPWIEKLQRAAESLATLDVLSSLAQVALERGYIRPEITQDNVLNIVGGKHPVVAELLREQFVPNDVKMGNVKDRLLIITGPNMAGKSTYIRQAALLTLMAQTGCYIPAESAIIGIADRLFTRVGAADELARGLSTFMLEMVETANILNNATQRSLVILDEVGRGTSTCDGLSLAWAICEYIALNIKCRTLFATHYHELTELEDLIDGVKNLNIAVREWKGDVIFLHKIIPGGTDRSYGVHVAKLAGVPKDVINRAQAILPQMQAQLADVLDMPDLADKARAAAAQMNLFADPAARIAGEIRHADLDNMTPIQAYELLRKLKDELS
ncbi:MAG TPA: DNA mismatch repair protein MutS [Phycisphaerae bacterium]|nr:DNA mismatch repair protein MutS [Phycisphaerae bacterium]HPS52145.1 DNA mismatch repair protein MutS [Phycisphaerae bacterium]